MSADKQYEVIDNSNNGSNYPTDLANGFIWFEITGDGTDGLTASTLILTAPESVSSGSALTVTATVTPNTATGTCRFVLDGDTSNPTNVVLTSGTATRTYTGLTVGTHSVSCTYSGDSTYRSNTSTISEITVTASTVHVSYTVDMADEGVQNASGTLTCTVNNETYTNTLVNGATTFNFDLLDGQSYMILFKYNDGENNREFMTSITVSSSAPNGYVPYNGD